MNVPFVKVNNQQELDRVVEKMQRETGLKFPHNYTSGYEIIGVDLNFKEITLWNIEDQRVKNHISADGYLTGIRTNFTLSDLKNGMVVELRDPNENLYMVLFDKIVNVDCYDDLKNFNEDFTHIERSISELDIVKIYKSIKTRAFTYMLSKDNLTLIFDAEAHRNKLATEQRKAEIQSKIDELNKQLEELK